MNIAYLKKILNDLPDDMTVVIADSNGCNIQKGSFAYAEYTQVQEATYFPGGEDNETSIALVIYF